MDGSIPIIFVAMFLISWKSFVITILLNVILKKEKDEIESNRKLKSLSKYNLVVTSLLSSLMYLLIDTIIGDSLLIYFIPFLLIISLVIHLLIHRIIRINVVKTKIALMHIIISGYLLACSKINTIYTELFIGRRDDLIMIASIFECPEEFVTRITFFQYLYPIFLILSLVYLTLGIYRAIKLDSIKKSLKIEFFIILGFLTLAATCFIISFHQIPFEHLEWTDCHYRFLR